MATIYINYEYFNKYSVDYSKNIGNKVLQNNQILITDLPLSMIFPYKSALISLVEPSTISSILLFFAKRS